ncbi:MAG: hypothetical protein Q4F66_06060 [Clostridium sp.]|nr:hypothetical protein [Clostridium sp.]
MKLEIEKQGDKDRLEEVQKHNLKNGRKKISRSDAVNEVIAIENKLGIKNDLILKANIYSAVGLILVLCGFLSPLFLIVGIAAEGLSIKVMLGRDYRRQKLWHKCIIHYAKGMYNQAKAFSARLPEEDIESKAYKEFISMVDSAIRSK